jgi:hypothetical protein
MWKKLIQTSQHVLNEKKNLKLVMFYLQIFQYHLYQLNFNLKNKITHESIYSNLIYMFRLSKFI